MEKLFLGIDVGTHSVRVGAFDKDGNLRATAEYPIENWSPRAKYFEQSSEGIWRSTCHATRSCIKAAKIDTKSIMGISFDATSSLVALSDNYEPVTISPTKNQNQNVISWLDQRAVDEADVINQTKNDIVEFFGGRIYPEMELPKLIWLKANLRDSWKRAKRLMNLSDYMIFRATGSDVRSLSTSVSRWAFLGHVGDRGQYPIDFFEQIGISDIFAQKKVPLTAYPPGTKAGELTRSAGFEMGLPHGIPVGVGLVDAHAGCLGSLGCIFDADNAKQNMFSQTISMIAGTSSCYLALSQSPRVITGISGPFYGAITPKMWLSVAGQSATGSLIDLVIESNSQYIAIAKAARAKKMDIYSFLNSEVEKMKAQKGLGIFRDFHVLPYHHGNRSPRADHSARGMVSGLNLSNTFEDVVISYYATMQAIGYGSRHIIEAMNENSFDIERIYLCGGLTKNKLFIQELADTTGCEFILTKEPDATLLGAAILAAVAAGEFTDFGGATKSMCRSGETLYPQEWAFAYHDAKYRVFKDMYELQKQIHIRMQSVRIPAASKK